MSPVLSSETCTVSDPDVGDAFCFVGQQGRQRVQGALGRAECPHFDPVAEQHDGHQQRQFPPEVQIEVPDPQAGSPGRDERDRDGHADQQHHPWLPVPQLIQAALEERHPSVEEDHRAKHRWDPSRAREFRGHVPQKVPEHRAEIYNRDREDQRQPEPVLEHGRAVSGVLAVAVHGMVIPVLVAGQVAVVLNRGRCYPIRNGSGGWFPVGFADR